jgi:hypothetical protein
MASIAATNALALHAYHLFHRSFLAEGNVISMPGQALGLCIGA